MRYILYIMWVCFALVGCRSKQEVMVAVDTTKIAMDSLVASAIRTESRGVTVDYGEWGSIEFADSGGVLRIDGGVLMAQGVRRYRQSGKMALTQNSMAEHETDSVVVRRSEDRGTTSREEPRGRKSGAPAGLFVAGLFVAAGLLLTWCKRGKE